MKQRLRADYDYVLIDSRTGLSDTAGICTVQMPDALLVFFTLNRQSVMGAAAVADSVREQRRLRSGEPGIDIWPVATRLDNAEMERLETAHELARHAFASHIGHLDRKMRDYFWGRTRVPYIPFYAYEEILAAIRDVPGASQTLLSAMEILAGLVVGDQSVSLRVKGERTSYGAEFHRAQLLKAYGEVAADRITHSSARRSSKGPLPRVFISYTLRDGTQEMPRRIAAAFQQLSLPVEVFWDERIAVGAPWASTLVAELAKADILLCLIGSEWLASPHTAQELQFAQSTGMWIMPVLLTDRATAEDLPVSLRSVRFLSLTRETEAADLQILMESLHRVLWQQSNKPSDPEDPQKGRWGGKASASGRKLEAKVKALSSKWFEVTLEVRSLTGKSKLSGPVTFFLHDTFIEPVREVNARAGKAVLSVKCYGAFTVGVVADEGKTVLELDLSKLRDAPKAFRER